MLLLTPKTRLPQLKTMVNHGNTLLLLHTRTALLISTKMQSPLTSMISVKTKLIARLVSRTYTMINPRFIKPKLNLPLTSVELKLLSSSSIHA
jgi:hypothetical protein